MSSSSSPEKKFSAPFSISRTFFYSIGLFPLPEFDPKWRPLTDLWFWVSYLNLVLCALLEAITMVLGFATDPSNFVANVAMIPLVSYTIIGLEQIINIYRRRDRVIQLVVSLRELFLRHSEKDLQRYNYEAFEKRSRKLQIWYATSYIFLILTFNFISIGRSIVNYFGQGTWHLDLPYAVWYPFDAYDQNVFLFSYSQQLMWGFTCVFGILAINLLLGTLTDQICFEFNALGSNLKGLQLHRSHGAEDREKIRQFIQQHILLFRLAEELQKIMSFTLLMNYLLISVVMCTVGFQVIATDSLSESLKFLLFLMVCLLQTLSLSYFGNCIIEASRSVGDRVYESDWLDGDLTSKKFILFIILRSRRPACLRAESFSIVSLQSFSSILSTSYSYFTILRQIYYGPAAHSIAL